MDSRSRASLEQFAVLLKFMESHGDIARPQQGRQGRINSDRLWLQLEKLLNSVCGGVIKSLNKWKKVWTDWKAKTKKKALAMRRDSSTGGGGSSSRQTLTAFEQRVLVIMGWPAVVDQAGIEERRCDDLPPEANLPQQKKNSVHTELNPYISTSNDVMLESVPICSIEGKTESSTPTLLPSSRDRRPPVSTRQPASASIPISPSSSVTHGTERIQRRIITPAFWPTSRRRRLFQRHRRRQTLFEKVIKAFVTIEKRRLQLEQEREKNYHEREIERMRLEARRFNIEESRNNILSRLGDIVANLTQILPQLRPSSFPSTDVL